MRLKTDFITNSSSSSFVAWGVSLDDIELPEEILLKIFDKAYKEALENAKEEIPPSYYTESLNQMKEVRTREEKLEWANDLTFGEKLEFLGYDMGSLEYNDSEYANAIGISPIGFIENFPTTPAGDVKKVVASEINLVFRTDFTEKDITYIEEAWLDG